MLKSMTAYSRSVLVAPIGRFVAELQSVNRKFLEVNTFLPKSLIRFDSDIKKWVSQQVQRGQVTVRLSAALDQTAAVSVKPNLALASQLKDSWDKIAEHLGVDHGQFSLQLIANEEEIHLFDEELHDVEKIQEALQTVIAQALNQLVEMKVREGEVLQADISSRLSRLREVIANIDQKAPVAINKYKDKLQQKLQEALTGVVLVDTDERLLKEVCLFADKVDVAEEITRFKSHLDQFFTFLQDHREGVGKTLEFLVQELNREINTISSKSSDVEIARLVIEAKTELERIREQIQNVE